MTDPSGNNPWKHYITMPAALPVGDILKKLETAAALLGKAADEIAAIDVPDRLPANYPVVPRLARFYPDLPESYFRNGLFYTVLTPGTGERAAELREIQGQLESFFIPLFRIFRPEAVYPPFETEPDSLTRRPGT